MVAEKIIYRKYTSVTVCVKLDFEKQTFDVWLTEILETFPRVFSFEKSRIKENGGKIRLKRNTENEYS